MPIRVVLADDDRGMRAVLEELIATDPDMEVVGSAEACFGSAGYISRPSVSLSHHMLP